MSIKQQKYPTHLVYSVLLHVIILTALIVSFEFSQRMPVVQNSDKPNEIINAMIMDSPPPVTKIIQNLPPPPPITPKEPIKTPQKPVTKPEEIVVKTKAIAIPDNQKKLQEEIIQKQLLADLKKQAEQKKKLKQKAVQAAFEKEMQEMKVQALQQQMLQEQKRVADARQSQVRGVVDKYKALILQAISRHWLIPLNVNKKLSAELLIRIAPGGAVLDVQLMKSSGDEALDRSARAAVFKASPLPVPTETDAFNSFRQFVLKVKPENVLANG